MGLYIGMVYELAKPDRGQTNRMGNLYPELDDSKEKRLDKEPKWLVDNDFRMVYRNARKNKS